jgi:hypothetical protein
MTPGPPTTRWRSAPVRTVQASKLGATRRQRGRLGYDPANETLDPSTPAGVGNLAAKAVLDFRHNDDSNQLNGYADTTGYQSKNTWDNVAAPWYWQPLYAC